MENDQTQLAQHVGIYECIIREIVTLSWSVHKSDSVRSIMLDKINQEYMSM